MAKLARVTIQRFKSIESIDFNVAALNVLVGGNNSGKTSVIQAIHFAFTLFQSMEISGKWPPRNKSATTISPEELIYIPSLDPYSLGRGGNLREADEHAMIFDFYFSDGEQTQLKVRKGRIRNVLVEPTNIEYLKTIAGLNEPYSIFSPGLAGVSKSEQYVSDGVLLRALSRGDANAFLRNTLWRLHGKNDAWAEFIGDLNVLFPHLEFIISFEKEIDEAINISIRRGSVVVPLDLAGTGLLQAIQIFAYLHLFKPQIMVFDEPDSHLHPNNQRNLSAVFKAIANDRGTQVILTTHSRHMIDALSDDCTIVWMQDGTARPASRDDQVDLLIDLGALDIRERLSRENPRFVILSEDAGYGTLEKIALASGFVQGEFQVHSYKGITGIHLLEPLLRQIRDVAESQIIVHRDRDFLEPDEIVDWENRIRGLGAQPFVTEDRDIEGYLIADQYLRNFLQANPSCSLEELKDIVVEGQQDKTVENYVNGRVDIERKAGRAAQINHGNLAALAARLCRNDPWGMMQSKARRRRIRGVLQERFGVRFRDPDINEVAPDQTLQAVRALFAR
ncbi:ATP-binding protein [Rhizobium sp. TRM95111]|uniref:ATP-dependent nuclease n=1 Tax=Rhizobium alarense TaxID=2846851 RepID=UPI001F321B1E|nr:ATP-binding protein [Rhizobium alarense]MCF3643038.1 ATP-binding protein [Rhizobium alarense]